MSSDSAAKKIFKDTVSGGVSPQKNDNILYDITNGKSKGGFGHPSCGGKEQAVAAKLPATRTVKK